MACILFTFIGCNIKYAFYFVFFCFEQHPAPSYLCGAGPGKGWRKEDFKDGFSDYA